MHALLWEVHQVPELLLELLHIHTLRSFRIPNLDFLNLVRRIHQRHSTTPKRRRIIRRHQPCVVAAVVIVVVSVVVLE